MRHKKPLTMMVTGVLFAIVCGMILTPAMVTESFSSSAGTVKEEEVRWRLTESQVVDPGQTTQNEQGTLITGYTVQANASGIGNAPVKSGRFILTASVFSPKADMPGQQAGKYYLHGSWTITDDKASQNERKARHSTAVVNGRLSAELPFNPLKERGILDAQVQLPMSPMGGWSKGQGSFSGDETFTGEMAVTLDRLPKAK